MVFLGQDPNQNLGAYTNNYVYDNSAGAGTTVYILDTGANMYNPVGEILLNNFILVC